jgi:HTH-type transcriptional regulator/antitoxin HigA
VKGVKMKNELDYKTELAKTEAIMLKGSENITPDESDELRSLAAQMNTYESEHFPLPRPQSIEAMIQWKMFELRLKQKDLAQLLDEPESRISEIIKGKRSINMRQAKKLHKVLNISAEFLLENA